MDKGTRALIKFNRRILALAKLHQTTPQTVVGLLFIAFRDDDGPGIVDIAGVGRVQFTPEGHGQPATVPPEPGGQGTGQGGSGTADHVEPTGCGSVLPQDGMEIDMSRTDELLGQLPGRPGYYYDEGRLYISFDHGSTRKLVKFLDRASKAGIYPCD